MKWIDCSDKYAQKLRDTLTRQHNYEIEEVSEDDYSTKNWLIRRWIIIPPSKNYYYFLLIGISIDGISWYYQYMKCRNLPKFWDKLLNKVYA